MARTHLTIIHLRELHHLALIRVHEGGKTDVERMTPDASKGLRHRGH
jgi:hypothetical protein